MTEDTEGPAAGPGQSRPGPPPAAPGPTPAPDPSRVWPPAGSQPPSTSPGAAAPAPSQPAVEPRPSLPPEGGFPPPGSYDPPPVILSQAPGTKPAAPQTPSERFAAPGPPFPAALPLPSGLGATNSVDDMGHHLGRPGAVGGAQPAALGPAPATSPQKNRGRHSRPRGTEPNLPAHNPSPGDHPTDAYGIAAGEMLLGGGGRKSRKADRGRRRKAPWWELPLLVAIAIVVAVLVKTFVVQPFYIPSESMEKTLHGCAGCSGDRILVNKPIYDLRDPHPGDVVVFHAPPGWDQEPASRPPGNPVVRVIRGFGQLVGFVPPDGLVLVKRVIAVGGETVKGVTTDNGSKDEVMVSDHGPGGPWRTLTEPYVYLPAPDATGTFGPVTVPKGRLWVMGDHRNDSADSRWHCPGTASASSTCDPVTSTVPVSDVIGKAVVIAWPPSRWRTLGTPSTFKHVTAAGLPAAAGLVTALPVWFVRRRRRSRLRRARGSAGAGGADADFVAGAGAAGAAGPADAA
jgi:signal peptidase I